MNRGLRWTLGSVLTLAVLAAVGWMVAGGTNSDTRGTRSSNPVDRVALEARRVSAPTTIYTWRSHLSDVVREVQTGTVLQVNIPSIREGWVTVFQGGQPLGYAPVDPFMERVDWTPPEPADTTAIQIEPASLLQINHITNYLKPDYALSDVLVTTSRRYEWTYYLGARVHGPDADGEIGLWLTKGALNQVHQVVTVNTTAARTSTASSARSEGANVSRSDPEAQRLIEYLTRAKSTADAPRTNRP